MATSGKAPDAFRTIGELSAELGVPQHILRYWETRFPQLLTRYGAELETRQDNYVDCWSGLKKRFDGTSEGNWD